MPTNFKPTKNTYVCSRHFKRENFSTQSTGKIVLKSLTVPSMNLPASKSATATPKNSSPATSKPSTPPPSENVEAKTEKEETSSIVVQENISKQTSEVAAAVSPKKTNSVKKEVQKRTIIKLPVSSKKSSKRLSAKVEKKKPAEISLTSPPEKVKASPLIVTPKKKNQVMSFVPGSSIEAQNFDSKWMPVKVIEVDMTEQEVLVRSSEKSNKSKTG